MMTSNSASKPQPASSATPSSPVSIRRRDSLNSISVSSQVDKEQLAQALDKIHTSASQSDTLTTFNDFAPPPTSQPATESKGLAGELVQNGLSGLYTRLKEAVGAVGGAARGQEADDGDILDTTSKKSPNTPNTTSKTSMVSLPRGEAAATSSTLNSVGSLEGPLTAVSSSGMATSDSRSELQQSSKGTTISAMIASKTTTSSRQSLPSMTKTSTAAQVDSASALGTLQRETNRSASRAEDGPSRMSGRKSISKVEGPPHPLMNTSESSSIYETKDLKGTIRPIRDDTLSMDGSLDSPLSPVKGTGQSIISTPELQASSSGLAALGPNNALRRPAVIDRITRSRSPGYAASQSSSVEHGTAEASPISTSAHNSVHHDSFTHETQPRQMRSGGMRIPGTTSNEGAPDQVNARLEMMRKQVLSKEFWMADETCKECFLCGNQFTAFRRKHHCRTCGCIFDSKCTSIISGQKFAVQGSLRVCKTCLSIINRRYDASASEESADDSYLPAIFKPNQAKAPTTLTKAKAEAKELSFADRMIDLDDARSVQTPMMAIPATRRIGDANRNSAVLEIDAPQQLSRPSSSRSLKSLASNRPQSSGHRRQHSKHNLFGRFMGQADDRVPFRSGLNEEMARKPRYPAFHDDNIIDPELAAYMSDESSGDEQQMSIFATMSSSDLQPASFDQDKSTFGQLLSTGRKLRHRQGEKSVSGISHTSRGVDDSNGPGSLISYGRPSRRRNLSNVGGAVHHLRSPRPKSGVFKGPSASHESVFMIENSAIEATKLTRSDSMREDKEPQIQLNPSSMQHVKKLLRQLLQDADIPNAPAWEKALIPILIQCTDDVTPDIRNGDDMDIRHYVKLKKIPGGKPGDTSYVSGVIFTKNLALKSMPRRIVNPRVVIVSFPIEYQRHQQHYMSLQPVFEQEKEFLRVVVQRIMNLRPQVLLAEKTVSGVALEYLNEANIAVAYNVKTEVLEAVSRCAETEIISSIDMLALPIQVGRAAGFEVKTYVNNDYPGRKKTYIFLSGCSEKLGCTIALRGASTPLLAQMKRITEFMVYVVYNLKLETCLMRDEFIKLPRESEDTSLHSTSVHSTSQQHTDESFRSMRASRDSSAQGEGLTVVINHAPGESEPPSQGSVTTSTNSTGEDSVASEHTEILAPIEHGQTKLISLHESHVSHASPDSGVPEDVPMPTFYSDMVAKYETKILSASPFVKFTQPYLLMKAREQERRLVYLKRLRDQDFIEEQGDPENNKTQPFQLIKPEMVHAIGQKAPRQIMEVLHAVHDAEYDKALHNYQTQTRQWENYIQGNLDLFDPYSHQNIVVLYSVICTGTKIPCAEPGLIAIAFYDEHALGGSMDPDCTLGQYVEDLCLSQDSICTANGCDRKMIEHHRTYVHDESRITIFVEQAPKQSVSASDDITMWSYCKVCKKDSPIIPMSESTWKYSFGKYLELLFWSKGLQLHEASECPHDHHRDHIRYFQYRTTWIRIHYDPIDLLEIIVPRARITWKVDHDLKLKNEIFTKIEERWTKFMTSVKARLKSIRIDSVLPEKAEACKAAVDKLMKKAQEDHGALIRGLQHTYVNSKYYEVIPFNVTVREMLERVGEWDTAFSTFEADFLPDKDLRQLTMIQLKKMFTDNESKESLPSTDGSVSTVDTGEPPSQTFTDPEDRTSTQPTDYTNPSLADSGTSHKPSDTDHGTAEGSVADSMETTLGSVEPLDLATPSSPASIKSPTGPPEQSGETSNASSSQDPTSPKSPVKSTPNLSPETSVGGQSLSEKVEQLRREHQTLNGETSTGETAEVLRVIPERGSSRRAGANVSPPMLRALSQPARTLPRNQSSMAKSLVPKEGKTMPVEGEVPVDGGLKVDKKLSERLGLGALKHRKGGPSSIPRFVHKKKESKVSTLARHFEQLSREFEKERIRDRKQRAAAAIMSQPRAFLPRTSAKAIVEVYDDVDEAVQEPGNDDHLLEKDHTDPSLATKHIATEPLATESLTTASSTEPPTPTDAPAQNDESHNDGETDDTATVNASAGGTDDEGPDSDGDHSLLDGILPTVSEIADSLEPSTEIPLELPKHQQTSLMKMLTTFWAERSSSGWPQLEYPVNASDHIFIDSDVIVREDEPSSLIAFALSSEDYTSKLSDIRRQWQLQIQREADEADLEPRSYGSSDAGEYVVHEAELEKSLLRATGTHLKYKFVEGSATMLCKIFYAEQFDALRRKCGAADRIIESLSRCLKWDSRGGKTKSVFLKTLDDRLVLKVSYILPWW
jgi:1-phosphatidylinositol-3-phosphate 5-kinase